MCKPTTFEKCVRAINEYAFVASPYPVIVTIENHCKEEGQKKQAQFMRSIWGSKLYVPSSRSKPSGKMAKIMGTGSVNYGEISSGPSEWLSPEELKGKILLRDKVGKLKETGKGESKIHLREASFLELVYLKNTKLKPVKESTIVDGKESAVYKYPQHGWCTSSSVSEKKLEKIAKPGANAAALTSYTKSHLIRSYPKGQRVDSSNYDPTVAWSCGVQIAALNYQTGDKPVWLSDGMFRVNGGCGYVLKPQFMLSDDATWNMGIDLPQKYTLEVRVMSAHFLPNPSSSVADDATILDPFVELSLHGIPTDTVSAVKTKKVENNGFNPFWDQTFEFPVHCEELAQLLIVIYDYEYTGKNQLVAHACLPTYAIREGVRAVKLYYKNGKPIIESYLLCHFKKVYQ